GVFAGTGTRTLLSAVLDRDDEVTFELCSGDAMDAATWSGATRIELMLCGDAGDERIFDTTFDPDVLGGACYGAHGFCLVFGCGMLTMLGTYDIRFGWDALSAFSDIPLHAHVLIHHSLNHD